ncbi:phosphoadenosine phosphosulfate reductase family protein, partial [Pyrobaculum sp.]|uniref:phosphoadenosine phosphosulfate reductase domain-containing protein n=1 Tax=Pyrobaculum sp. TaxID=2004705 RepID=UPI003D0F431F
DLKAFLYSCMKIALLRNFKNYKVFEEAAKKYRHFVVAYSGGKDSTAVAILLYQWVEQAKPSIKVTLLYNDTLSEVNALEAWVRYFTQAYTEKIRRHVDISVRFVTPEITKTFFWRVFVRGYPAPTFRFRWCVDHLKLEPMTNEVKKLENAIIVTGQRDEESGARAASMKKSFGSCAPGTCLGAYFSLNGEVPKIAPIRFWTTQDVWRFLLHQKEFDITPLIRLYGLDTKTLIAPGGRFGCWHCTLVKIHSGLFFGDKNYAYVEALRLIYKAVSDLKEMRVPKTTSGGYSKLGPLTPLARSIIYHLAPIVEEKSGHRFYALDEVKLGEKSMREIFYEVDAESADVVIRQYDRTDRWIGMRRLRKIESELLRQYIDKILERVRALDYTTLATRSAEEMLQQLIG